MNKRRRVLVIARHFWPVVTDDSLRLYHWLQSLRRDGAAVTVLTPRWHPSWPGKIVCDEIPVLRLDSPPIHSLRLGRYTRQLGQLVSQLCAQFDLIYCDQPDIEANAILDHVPSLHRPPLVVRFEPEELAGNSPAVKLQKLKSLDVCRRADVVLTHSATAHQQLIASGLMNESILRAAQSPGRVVDRSRAARGAARQMLSQVNHDLFVRSQERLLVCPGELSQRWGVKLLIRALAPLIVQHRPLRLWILGDSRERPEIYELLREQGLHRLVAMPGIFTDPEPILQAADLCVFPAAGVGLGWLVPSCVASSIPVLVCDAAEARQLLDPHARELTVRMEEPGELRERIASWLSDPAPLTACIDKVRQRRLALANREFECNELFRCLQARI